MNPTTTHECTKHAAGNRSCYVVHRCRCAECRAASTRYESERARRKVYEDTTPGVPSSFVSGDVVRAHLRTLMEAGMGWKRIAGAAGVKSSTVYPILYGKHLGQPDHPEHRPPRVRVTRAVADAILAVELDLADGVPVDQTGTARRVQALVARGWSGSRIAGRLGVERSNFTAVMNGTHLVTVATREAVRALYDELWDVAPPEDNHRDRIAATRARRLAQRRGWVPPLAWDDETIDDPTARPDLGEREVMSLVEQVRELADLGYLLPEIAARLGKDDKVLRSYLLARDAELAARVHVELNGRAPYGEGITIDPRRRKAA